ATGQQALLPELVHADLEFRLKAGESVRVEDYLRRYPGLSSDAQILVGLLAAEFTLRRRLEPELTFDDYRQRFPQHAAELERRHVADEPDSAATARIAAVPLSPAPQDGPVSAGRYRTVRLHASGGLGEVHLAEDTELGRPVALKLIRPQHRYD